MTTPYRFTNKDVAFVTEHLEKRPDAEYVVGLFHWGLAIVVAIDHGKGDQRLRNAVRFDFGLGQRSETFYDSFPSREAFLAQFAHTASTKLNLWLQRKLDAQKEGSV